MSAIIDYRGKTPTKEAHGVPLVTAKVVKGGRILTPNEFIAEDEYDRWMRRGLPKVGDVLLTTEAPLGEVAQLRTSRVALAQRLICLRGKRGVLHNGFLKFLLQSPAVQAALRARATGTTVLGIKQSELRKVILELPPMPYQRAIAHILGTLDDKIELNRRMNETLEAMARAIFKSWFVDFDPVRAKAEGRDTGLPDHLAELFPDSFEDSELGGVPAGWVPRALGDLIELNPRLTLKRGEVAPYLDMANTPTVGHSPAGVRPREYTSGTRFKNGDTLLARITPCLENGKTAYVDFLGKDEVGWGSTEFIVMRPRSPWPGEFAYCLARDPSFREYAIQRMTGSSGRQRVRTEALGHLTLSIPPDELGRAFGSLVKPLFERASAGSAESETLAELRDTLLPKLISGELRIEDPDRFLKEVAA